MTMTEKILARASERASLEPGENVWVDVDVLMTHDVCGPGTIGIFKKEFGANAKVWDPEKLVIIPDHYIFTSDERANRNVDILRDFCKEQDIKYFYDIKDLSDFRVWKHGCLFCLFLAFNSLPHLVCPASHLVSSRIMLVSYLQANPDYKGVCHVALAQEGHCRPGEVLF
jgi:3-isopropylmalate/(R)-2-methylmalate dehydratase large subunit